MLKTLFLATILSTVLCVSSTLACGCTEIGQPLADKLEWALKNSAGVFYGKVDRFVWLTGVPTPFVVDDMKFDPATAKTKTAVFTVERWWKGDSFDPEALVVTDEFKYGDGYGGGTSCDYGFEQGKTYLVFATKRGKYLTTHSCDLTRQENQSKEIRDLLGEGKPPVVKPTTSR